jgi:hypothetical protein
MSAVNASSSIFVALVDIDGAPGVAFEAGIEEAPRQSLSAAILASIS